MSSSSNLYLYPLSLWNTKQAITPITPLCTSPSLCLTVSSNLTAQIPPVRGPEYRPQFPSCFQELYLPKRVKGPWGGDWDSKALGTHPPPTHTHILTLCFSKSSSGFHLLYILVFHRFHGEEKLPCSKISEKHWCSPCDWTMICRRARGKNGTIH